MYRGTDYGYKGKVRRVLYYNTPGPIATKTNWRFRNHFERSAIRADRRFRRSRFTRPLQVPNDTRRYPTHVSPYTVRICAQLCKRTRRQKRIELTRSVPTVAVVIASVSVRPFVQSISKNLRDSVVTEIMTSVRGGGAYVTINGRSAPIVTGRFARDTRRALFFFTRLAPVAYPSVRCSLRLSVSRFSRETMATAGHFCAHWRGYIVNIEMTEIVVRCIRILVSS